MKKITAHGRLFQARVWREYAMTYDGKRTSITGVDKDWVATILKKSRSECIRRCRISIYLLHRLNRK